jgi:hypothetical protein
MKMFSVTQVLGPYQNFDSIPSHILERATERGIEVHRACANYASGIWVKKLAIDVIPYVHSFIRWFNDYVAVVYMIEERLKDESLGFHGRLDFFLQLVDDRRMVVDIKTPVIEGLSWKCQLSAYKHLVEKNRNENGIGCMSLRLDPKGGDAKAVEYVSAPDHFQIFLSALNCYRYFNG